MTFHTDSSEDSEHIILRTYNLFCDHKLSGHTVFGARPAIMAPVVIVVIVIREEAICAWGTLSFQTSFAGL